MALLTAVQTNLELEGVKKVKVNGLDNLVNHLLPVIKKIRHNWYTRNQLAKLSDHALKDIGLTKADAYEEVSKPLWK